MVHVPSRVMFITQESQLPDPRQHGMGVKKGDLDLAFVNLLIAAHANVTHSKWLAGEVYAHQPTRAMIEEVGPGGAGAGAGAAGAGAGSAGSGAGGDDTPLMTSLPHAYNNLYNAYVNTSSVQQQPLRSRKTGQQARVRPDPQQQLGALHPQQLVDFWTHIG